MPPEYALVSCGTAGESLTGSAVARKLEGLGALTKGDKSAGRGETGNNLGVNMETKAGLDALKQLTAFVGAPLLHARGFDELAAVLPQLTEEQKGL
eukprot:3423023-Prymnesium_polylepis.1